MNNELLNRVLTKSREVFIKYGVKSVTMDDLSKELGISKKTLYTIVKDKNELIEKTTFAVYQDVANSISELLMKKLDPISELMEVEAIACKVLTRIDPSVIHQFKKYYPEIYTKLQETQKSAIVDIIKTNLKRGIDDGLYRADINIDFIANLDYRTTHLLIDSDFFPSNKFEITKIKHEYLIYHLRGIASYRGLSFIESKLTEH